MMEKRELTRSVCLRKTLNKKTIMSLFLLVSLFVLLNLLVASSGLSYMYILPNKMKSGFLESFDNFLNISGLSPTGNFTYMPGRVTTKRRLNHDMEGHSNITQSALRSASNTSVNIKMLSFNSSNDTVWNISRKKDPNINIRGNVIGTKNNTRKEECNYCFEHNFNYSIQNDQICRLYNPDQVIDVLILVTTIHKNLNQRNALRKTWLSISRNNTSNVRYVFLLGEITDERYRKLVIEENKLHHDIIKEDFVDSYNNLTYKSIMGFKWAATICKNAQYVMKTDDDMFVNVPNVVKLVNGIYKDELEKTIVGSCSTKAKPIRNVKSKWYASEESYPEPSYPGFCSGTGYLTSMNVARKVYEVSPHVPFFHLEDVYVSLCIRRLDYKLLKVPGFNVARPKIHPCLYKTSNIITAHHLSPMMLTMIWRGKCKPLVRL